MLNGSHYWFPLVLIVGFHVMRYLSINVTNRILIISWIHRPSNADIDDTKLLINDLFQVSRNANPFVVFGDFNLPNIN